MSELRVQLLGGFSVEYAGEELNRLLPRAHTLWKLFRYLLVNAGKAATTENLIDVLWAEGETDNPRKALQNLMYRLRKILPPADDSGKEYILTQQRTYSWNPQAAVKVDAWEFDALAKRARGRDLSDAERCKLAGEACALYTGDCMEDLLDNKWAESLASYYRRQYFECTNVQLEVYQQAGRYGDVVDLCAKVLENNMFEEHYHAALIRAMLAQGNRYGALAHYRSITSTLLKELDVEPSEELYAAGRSIYEGGIRMETDLGTVIDDLRAAAGASGPMVCEQDIFRYLFQFYERKIRRDGTSCVMVMYTLRADKRSLRDDEAFQILVALKRACILSLRRSDVVTQQSNAQLLLLLPGATEESAKLVLARIQQRFRLLCHNENVHVNAQLRSLAAE